MKKKSDYMGMGVPMAPKKKDAKKAHKGQMKRDGKGKKDCK